MHYKAAELIEQRRAWIRADEQRMIRRPQGYCRAAWRDENPVDIPLSWRVLDTAFKTQPRRLFSFDVTAAVGDLWVWSCGKRPFVVEHIDLLSPDADERLTRYLVDQSASAA